MRVERLSKDEVLFVGNQLNTDITGGEQYGIRTVWLCGRPYRSIEECQLVRALRQTLRKSRDESERLIKFIVGCARNGEFRFALLSPLPN